MGADKGCAQTETGAPSESERDKALFDRDIEVLSWSRREAHY
jgi:hypothetical protein